MPTTDLFRATPFAEAMSAVPVLCYDIGARGGIDSDLAPIAFATDTVGFEPDEDAHRRLSQSDLGPWRSRTLIPMALGARAETRRLNLTRDPVSTTLMTPDPSIGRRFNKPQFFDVVGTVDVATIDLDSAVAQNGGRPPDYIKIDVEGAEAEIMGSGGAATMGEVLAVKTEVGAFRFREEQPVFAELDTLLRGCGFEMMDITNVSRWRVDGYVIPPRLGHGRAAYSRGQWMQADVLYVRRPDQLPAGDDASDRDAADRLLRTAWLLLAQGFFDHADALLRRPAATRRLREDFNCDPEAALHQASRTYGRHARRHALRTSLRSAASIVKNMLRGGASR